LFDNNGAIVISFFTIPKSFDGPAALAQSNAIRSWRSLPGCETILIGDDPGVADFAATVGAMHISDVQTSEAGVPLLSSAFTLTRQSAMHDILAFVNTDIILTTEIIDAARAVSRWRKRFLITGRRINIDLNEALDFAPGWDRALRMRAWECSDLHPGHDYFIFPRHLWLTFPPFAAGHEFWSAWLTYSARTRKAAVIDATQTIPAFHQVHASNPGRSHSEDWKRNKALMGGPQNSFLPSEATHALTTTGIRCICRSCYPVCACQFQLDGDLE